MSSKDLSIQNVLIFTTRPPPQTSKPSTTGTKFPTMQQIFGRKK
ncbi:hypothetical protein MtrunA17_Chr4g0052281 [Medicago truncatula]|uniref:Uncharacterized protein n=1 Tax=Medicago truncatula TaxID=3880 RepID=A0A396IB94_MEDTR|nr:hypothetical protein MtrunA17_Chr4g0052281 [Medicago truncatula]